MRANLERHVARGQGAVAPTGPSASGCGSRRRRRATPGARPRARGVPRLPRRRTGSTSSRSTAFPTAPFHGTAREGGGVPARLARRRAARATRDRLAELLAALLPATGLEGTVSTVPGASRRASGGAAGRRGMADRLLRHAADLHRLRERTGQTIVARARARAVLPLETLDETVRFFERAPVRARRPWPRSAAWPAWAGAAEAALRRHLGVCFDACHMAVEFEDAGGRPGRLARAGIRIAQGAGERGPARPDGPRRPDAAGRAPALRRGRLSAPGGRAPRRPA